MNLKSKMTKFMAVALMVTVGLVATPRKSEAGVILIVSGGTAALIIGSFLIAGGSVSGILTATGDFDTTAGLIGTGGLMLLSADGSLPADQLQSQLEKKYSFIENKSFFRSLSNLVKKKADAIAVNEWGQKKVSISREETVRLLSAVDVTGYEAQTQKMILDLE